MSRSYKKYACGQWACGLDKWARSYYHKSERRQVKNLLKEQEKYGTKYFKPYKEECCLYGNVCQDDDYYIDEISSTYIHNACVAVYGKKEVNTLHCSGCYWSTNHEHNWDYDIWEEEPQDRIITSKINYTVRYADRWSWPSDGGTYWKSDISEIRKNFDENVFGARGTNIWKDYVSYRNIICNKKRRFYIVRFFYREQIGNSIEPIWYEDLGKSFKRTPLYKETYKDIKVKTNPSKMKFENDGWYKMTYWKERIFRHYGRSDLLYFLFSSNMIPMSLWGPKDFVEWLRAHEEDIVRAWLKNLYLRK